MATGKQPITNLLATNAEISGAVAISGALAITGDVTVGPVGSAKPLLRYVNNGGPILGICLGMQLFFEKSYEFGEKKGLGFIPGEIKKFPKEHNGKKLKIPNIGWNKICFNNKLLTNLKINNFDHEILNKYLLTYMINPNNIYKIINNLNQLNYQNINIFTYKYNLFYKNHFINDIKINEFIDPVRINKLNKITIIK